MLSFLNAHLDIVDTAYLKDCDVDPYSSNF